MYGAVRGRNVEIILAECDEQYIPQGFVIGSMKFFRENYIIHSGSLRLAVNSGDCENVLLSICPNNVRFQGAKRYDLSIPKRMAESYKKTGSAFCNSNTKYGIFDVCSDIFWN